MGTEPVEDAPPDRKAQILDAAFEEFATQGYLGATIKRIAQRAHLQAQGLIYFYFPSKEALFQAVLARHLPILRLLLDPAPLLDRPPQEVLSLVARTYLTMVEQPAARQLVRLLVAEAVRRPEALDTLGGGMIARARDFFTTYLARQVELGRLRPHDVRASARAFFGMLVPPIARQLLESALPAPDLTTDDYVEMIVALFLRGLEPEA
jgi:TetR/AcrR family transcriptional regulator